MDTKWEKISREHIDEDLLREAGEIIRRGGLVAFPTETVYGLGGDALILPEDLQRKGKAFG